MKEKRDIEQLYANYFHQLENLSHPNHKKILLCFSAVPGSGKTYVAKKIEKKYKGLRISTDEMRAVVSGLKIQTNPQQLLEKFTLDVLKNIEKLTPNTFVILDASVDRTIEKVELFAKQEQWKLFLVRLEVAPHIIQARIQQRDGEKAHVFLDNLAKYQQDFQKLKDYKADFVLHNTTDSEIELLFSKIEKI